jgi:aminoglycoside phosphotransferase (APT) family kinase protein
MESNDIVHALRRLRLVGADDEVRLIPLTGGVSSDIYLVQSDGGRFCVKRALARLKVSAVWEAPLERNAAEAAWIRTVGEWLPNAVPAILGEDNGLGLFAMAYLPPEENPVWKSELLRGVVDIEFAQIVGRQLAQIHARSAADPALSIKFANDKTFEQIRIEPYLRATARAHPDLAAHLDALADVTLHNKRALVHGDVSPKNILCGVNGPLFLDAECAWFGDPAFDLAFCLNHFLLKGARNGVSRAPYREAFRSLTAAYMDGVTWERRQAVEARAAALLPALFLARVDGKSPVEYLTLDHERANVRSFARSLIGRPTSSLLSIADLWSAAR